MDNVPVAFLIGFIEWYSLDLRAKGLRIISANVIQIIITLKVKETIIWTNVEFKGECDNHCVWPIPLEYYGTDVPNKANYFDMLDTCKDPWYMCRYFRVENLPSHYASRLHVGMLVSGLQTMPSWLLLDDLSF